MEKSFDYCKDKMRQWTTQKDVMNCNTSTLMWKPFSHRHSIYYENVTVNFNHSRYVRPYIIWIA